MDQKSQVAIVVDSAASLPPEILDRPGIHVVPMRFVIDGETYRDGRDLSATDFYGMVKGLDEPPTTSAPSPADFMDAFREAARHASSVLCLTVSPRFSSSLDSARAAAEEAREALTATEIVLLDSESAAGGEGLVATDALRIARAGSGIEAVVAAAKTVVARVSLFAFLDTLYYVWRTGRVPRVAYAGTSLLDIKPLFELHRGEIRNLARPRTSRRAAQRLLELMRRRVGRDHGRVHATVMHADAADAAEELSDRLRSEFDCQELFVSEFSPVMGTHTGPGLLGVAFWSEG